MSKIKTAKNYRKPQNTKPSVNVSASYQQALALHQNGNFAEAEQLYRQILALQPLHADTLHLFSLIQKRKGNFVSAFVLIDRATEVQPNNSVFFSDRGIVLLALNCHEEALVSLNRALALEPNNYKAHFNKGNVLVAQGRHEAALASFDKTLALQPNLTEAHVAKAFSLKALERMDLALASLNRAIALRHEDVAIHFAKGEMLASQERYQEALISFNCILNYQPEHCEALIKLGHYQHKLNLYGNALASFERVITLEPSHYDANFGKAIALEALKRHEEALLVFDRMIEHHPMEAAAHRGKGTVLLTSLSRFDEALSCFNQAIALETNFADAYLNRGVSLEGLKRYEEALADYILATEIKPDCPVAHFNESLCRLKLGHYAQGWRKHEWRWLNKSLNLTARYPDFPDLLWLGEQPLSGKTILLHFEQGFGDTLQFCRYAKLAAEQGAKVIMDVQTPLQSLLQASLAEVSQMLVKGDSLPNFDFHCPIMSLALAFKTDLDSIPASVPYLFSPLAKTNLWQVRLGEKKLPRIGLAWSGNIKPDPKRSIPLVTASKLFSSEQQFICLQKEIRPEDQTIFEQYPQLQFFGEQLQDFSDTAALIELMDLVISIDTSVAHLAGAMGKPVWLLLPFNADWRWLLDRDDSPWYPTMRLFRQSAPGDWDSVIDRVASALQKYDFATNTVQAIKP
jgi:tetratricopeptide (TPR) repeat protein